MSEPRLARGPLRPRLRMRLHLDYWSATSTALELVPCQRVRATAQKIAMASAVQITLFCAPVACQPI